MDTKQQALNKVNQIANLHLNKYGNLPMATGLLQYLEDAVSEYFVKEKRCDDGN